MNTEKPWKIALLLAGIFLTGAVSGAFLTAGLIRHFGGGAGPHPEKWAPARMQLLSERLNLTPEQVERIKPIIRRQARELNRVRTQSLKDSRAILENQGKEIAAELTPAQREQYDRLNAELSERAFRRFDGKPGGGPGRPPQGMKGSQYDGPPPPPHDAQGDELKN